MAQERRPAVGVADHVAEDPGRAGESTSQVALADRWVLLAHLEEAHGVQGRLRARLAASDADDLLALSELTILDPSGAALGRGRVERIAFGDAGAPPGGRCVVALAGVRGRRDAQRFRNCWLAFERSGYLDARRTTAWVSESAPLEVFDESGGSLGHMVAMQEGGRERMGVVLRVEGGGKALETRIPFGWGRIRTVDLRTRRVVVREAGRAD